MRARRRFIPGRPPASGVFLGSNARNTLYPAKCTTQVHIFVSICSGHTYLRTNPNILGIICEIYTEILLLGNASCDAVSPWYAYCAPVRRVTRQSSLSATYSGLACRIDRVRTVVDQAKCNVIQRWSKHRAVRYQRPVSPLIYRLNTRPAVRAAQGCRIEEDARRSGRSTEPVCTELHKTNGETGRKY